MRWGLGPVFIYECLANSRRWQTYAIRSVGVALLLAAIVTIAMSHMRFEATYTWREYAELGVSYFYAVIGVELTLVMLAAPAATAGAICVDRARGTLAHMLATDLSDPEIVLGKLAARLLPVLGLVACSWPVLALSSLLGGIDPHALTLAFAIILAVALLGCAMALALSVWARKPHEVVLVVYTFWALVLLLWPIWYVLALVRVVGPVARWSLVADPYYLAFAPYSAPGRVDSRDYLGFFAATLGASVLLAVVAVWRMRPVARRGTDEGRGGPRLGWVGRLTRRLPGPALDGNPVLWREWHRSRPSRWTTILIVLLGGSTGVACVVGAATALTQGIAVRPGTPPVGLIVGIGGAMLQLIFGLLVLSAVAPTSMSEERQRGSLDLLAATTLSTPTIVLGKWLGTLRQVALLAIGPGLLGLALALAVKFPWTPPPGLPARYYEELSDAVVLFGAGLLVATILAHGALMASAGLALAVWIARQSRAIALSVGFAVVVGAGWPILVQVTGMGPGAQIGPGVPEPRRGRIQPPRVRRRSSPRWDRGPLVDHVLGHRVPGAGPGAIVADGADLRWLLRPHPRPTGARTGARRRCRGPGRVARHRRPDRRDRGLDPRDLGLHARGGHRRAGLRPPGCRRLRPAGRAGRVIDGSGRHIAGHGPGVR